MALYSLRLRRTLTTLSSLTNHHHHLTTLTTTPIKTLISPSSQPSKPLPFQSRSFKSSSLSLSSFRRSSPSNNNSSYGGQDEKLDPDAILFEGCDYNHWLITMDFPKPPNKPTPQQMVDTYVETCAKGLNISVEEAKKKIYACSTTTYEGFQAVMTEEESEKFQGLPGVVFILPDSYIDPANKEYGGDKYMNGVIIPRPPPVQYGRQRERNFTRRGEEPRFDPQRRQGNPPYNQQGPMQGDGRNYGAPQNIPPQQNGPDGQGERRGPMPMNNTGYAPGGTSSPQGERREPMPPYQGNYNQADQRNYTPQEQRDFRGDNRNYGPAQGGNYGQAVGGPYGQGAGGQGQGVRGSYGQGVGGSYGQGVGGSYGQGVGGSYGQGAGSGGSYGQGAQSQGVGGSFGQGAQSQGVGGSYGQGAQSQGVGGSYGQGAQSQGVGGSYGQGAQSQGVGGSYGQGAGLQGVGGSYGQGTGSQGVGGAYGPGGGQRPSQVDEGNYTTRGQSVTEQGRY